MTMHFEATAPDVVTSWGDEDDRPPEDEAVTDDPSLCVRYYCKAVATGDGLCDKHRRVPPARQPLPDDVFAATAKGGRP